MLLRVLLLAEPAGLRDRVLAALTSHGALAQEESDPGKLWERLGQESFDLVVLTRSALGKEPFGNISEIRQLPNRPEIIVLSDSPDPEETAILQSSGAFSVVSRSLPVERMTATFGALLRRFREIGVSRLEGERHDKSKLGDFASESPAMKRLLELARRVAASDTSLLILGETGVGKEWLARAIHSEGPRAPAPFIAVNCAAVPENLLESELFGHEKGAFTGAIRSRRGCFELAHRGSLFLDEVADIPVHLQAKLLRALQDRKVQRVGAESPIDIDVRIMAATNRDLEEAMAQGHFRSDIFYRLSVVTLTVPPLRERREDIGPLVENYLAEFRSQLGKLQIRGVDETAVEAMIDYAWPGNVRELINVMERAVLLCDTDVISLEHLPVGIAEDSRAARLRPTTGTAGPIPESLLEGSLEEGRMRIVAAYERRYLTRVLARTDGRIGEAARLAGVDPRTLYNKLKAHGIRKEDFKPSV
jgi:DNA-binding NtrC family response regulator